MIMNKNYELTLLARPDVSDEDVKMAMQTVHDAIVSNNGSVLYAEYWGLRQLEYKINKNDSASFYMIQFNSDKEVVDMLNEKLKNSEIFIRYLLVVAEDEALKVKSANCLLSKEQAEDGVVFDKRYFNVLSEVFNLK